jgi:hypothetical protein
MLAIRTEWGIRDEADPGHSLNAQKVRIPVKWSGDSGDVGQCRSEATLAGLRMIQVDHIRQEVAL